MDSLLREAFDKKQLIILRQFNACLYLEMVNNFVVDFDAESLRSFFDLSRNALTFGETEFCFEVLNRLLVSFEGLSLFINQNDFLINIKQILVKVANQEIKKKILNIIELAICSKKIRLETQQLLDHFSSTSYLRVMFFFFFNSLENSFSVGEAFYLTNLQITFQNSSCDCSN